MASPLNLVELQLRKAIEAYVAEQLASRDTEIDNLNAWATATATKLNAQFVVANAETTLPFSPALAVDYDTNPQA